MIITHFPSEKGWIISNQSAELTAYDIYHKEVIFHEKRKEISGRCKGIR